MKAERQLHLYAHELHGLVRREHQAQRAVFLPRERGRHCRGLHAEMAALLRAGKRERLHLRAALISDLTFHVFHLCNIMLDPVRRLGYICNNRLTNINPFVNCIHFFHHKEKRHG